jgi:hypothetical protein
MRATLWLAFSLAALLAFLSASPQAAAQLPSVDQTTNPYTPYHSSDLESVSVANGKLVLHIPILAYSQRGTLQVSFTGMYDNRSIREHQVCTTKCQTFWNISGTGVHVRPAFPYPREVTGLPPNNIQYYEIITPGSSTSMPWLATIPKPLPTSMATSGTRSVGMPHC